MNNRLFYRIFHIIHKERHQIESKMKVSLLFHTLIHLKTIQLFYQIKYRINKAKYCETHFLCKNKKITLFPPIPKYSCIKKETFTFLNLSATFHSWNDTRQGMLWAYNLNYMDWLQQENMSWEEGAQWIDRFIADLPKNKIGLDPYPIALRGINWIKFIVQHSDEWDESRIKRWNQSLYSQYRLLIRKLEYHLLGNHLLEDAYSLFFASIYFADKTFYDKATQLLSKELNEQILNDGAHYEQSPMYHCILLDRLLDCYNLSAHNMDFEGQETISLLLKQKAELMLGHLSNILYKDGTYPLFNDSTIGIAPTPEALFQYAQRLSITWSRIALKDCGYRKIQNTAFEGFVDVGNITATYQPGHTHADTFSYELRIKDKPFIIDTGISTYNKTQRRQYERSTSAHNTVTIAHTDSNEVWGGFRVGRRAHVILQKDTSHSITAVHSGFGRKTLHKRTFALESTSFTVRDDITSDQTACSHIHFAPEATIISYTNNQIQTNVATICIENADSVEIHPGKASTAYNTFQDIAIARIHFKHHSIYRISIIQ